MTDTPENARIAQGSTLVIIDFILKPASENEGIAAAIGMGCGVVVFIIYLLCLKCCFQDVGSERSRKWFKTPPQGGDGAMGGHYNSSGGGGTLAGSASHLNGLGTLTGGDPEAEYQLRMLLNAMSTTGSPRSQFGGGGGGGSPRGEDNNNNLQNSFSAAAVQSGSFTGYPPASTTTTGALMTAATAASAVPPPRGASAESLSSLRRGQQQEQQQAVVVVPDAVNSTAPPPLDGSPPMAHPR